MISTYTAVLLASILACLVTTAGIYVIGKYEAWGRSNIDPLINRITRPTLGALLAVSAGALLYVGASHLLPEVEREDKQYTIISLAVGVLVATFIVIVGE